MSRDDADDERVRLDKWLWAARFFKTRTLATEAVDGGKVDVNGARAKPSKLVGVGDDLRVTVGEQRYVLRVAGTGERRGSAEVARTLYEETAASQADRARQAEQRKLAATQYGFDAGRPNKKDRRDLRKFRDR